MTNIGELMARIKKKVSYRDHCELIECKSKMIRLIMISWCKLRKKWAIMIIVSSWHDWKKWTLSIVVSSSYKIKENWTMTSIVSLLHARLNYHIIVSLRHKSRKSELSQSVWSHGVNEKNGLSWSLKLMAWNKKSMTKQSQALQAHGTI